MDSKIWKKDFKKIPTKFPSQIAKDYCDELYDLTEQKVIAKVERYEKNIFNMTKVDPIIGLSAIALLKTSSIEDNLGEVSENEKFTYELYLTGTKTTEYKYRFAFVESGICPYPVKLAIDSDISKELNINKIVECANQEEYETLLKSILNSQRMVEIIEGLMAINSEE